MPSPFLSYADLKASLSIGPLAPLAALLPDDLASSVTHGDFTKWQRALQALPILTPSSIELNSSVTLGVEQVLPANELQQFTQTLMQLHPWRKGPFNLFGVNIDTEWRSDWKWDRVLPHISSLQGRTVLDVGCGNGYHCWRIAGAGAKLVIGVEPMLLYVMQYWALRHFLPEPPVWVVPMTLEQMPESLPGFDTVFSMGVLYHRRSPFDHLEQLKKKLRKGGELVLETLVVEGEAGMTLVPPDRYCRMNNVWFLPSPATLQCWLEKVGFCDVKIVDVTTTTTEEQRQTPWMTFESLAHALDPAYTAKTVEGLPAPVRAVLVATLS